MPKKKGKLRVPRRWLPKKLTPEPLESHVEFDDDTTQDALPPEPPTQDYRPQPKEPDTVVMPIETIEAIHRAGPFDEDYDTDVDTDTDTDRDPWAELLAENQPVYCTDEENTPITSVERPPVQWVASQGVRQVLLESTATNLDTEVDLEPLPSEEEPEYVPLPSGEMDRIDTSEEVILPATKTGRWLGPLIILVMLLAGASAAFVLYGPPG